MTSTSLKVLSKGVFTITSVRADAARRKNNNEQTNGKNGSESSLSEHGSLPRRISTPELLRHVAAVANIKVNNYELLKTDIFLISNWNIRLDEKHYERSSSVKKI